MVAAEHDAMEAEDRRRERERLAEVVAADGVRDRAVLEAIAAVPRERFVPDSDQRLAYGNFPLPIGHEQTISQPYVVAFMTEAVGVGRTSRVLEVGTGSGYQAAVLAHVLGLGPDTDPREPHGSLYTIEIIAPLAERARTILEDVGYRGIQWRIGDGYRGWPEAAPFDAILVTAAPDHVPPPLLEQLAPGGRLVIPVGTWSQDVTVITRTEDGYHAETVLPVRFVPMTGEAQQRRDRRE